MKKEIFNDKKLKDRYRKYLKNKRVALVGPGWHTKNTRQQSLIDSYDIVVRINDGIELAEKHPEDIGKRTDILYCTLTPFYLKDRYIRGLRGRIKRKAIFTIKKIKEYERFLKWIVITHAFIHQGNVRELRKRNEERIPICLVEKEIFKKARLKKNKSKISAGSVTIYDLLQYEIKELYITGITFYDRKSVIVKNNKVYRSGYRRRTVTESFKGHDIEGELKFFVKLCKKDERIVYDETLNKIVMNNY